MEILLTITSEQIANLMTTAIESGDPVTTAARGGWCSAIQRRSGPAVESHLWYSEPGFWPGDFAVEVSELDEDTGETTKHTLDARAMRRGLMCMAMRFPKAFAQILGDDIDAPCADLFLQACVFGEEKYA